MSYTPQFNQAEQTPTQRWHAVRWALCAGATDSRMPSSVLVQLALRYIAGEIDHAQLRDELLRWYKSDEQPSADVRPLPPAQPGHEYPYAAEMAVLLANMRQIPAPVPYTVEETNLPRV